MQASLQQAMPPQPGSPATGTPFSGGVWSGSSWLLAAASVSTVVLIAFSIWQRSEINTLRETVGQLKQQVVAARPAPASATPDSPALAQPDNLDRSLPAPAGTDGEAAQVLPGNRDTVARTRSGALPRSERPETADERTTTRMDIPPKQRDAVAGRTSVPVDDARPPVNSNKNLQTDNYGASSTLTSTQPLSDPSVITSKPVRRSASEQPANPAETRNQPFASSPVNPTDTRNGTMANRDAPRQNRSTTQAGNVPDGYRQSAKPNQQVSETTASGSDQVNANPSGAGVTGTEASETYRLANSLPLSLPARDWNSALTRRAKRMRLAQPVQPTAPVAPQSVAKAPASSARCTAGSRIPGGRRQRCGCPYLERRCL